MADAKKCDRCGAFYQVARGRTKPLVNGIDLMDLQTERIVERLELCPSCAAFVSELIHVPMRELKEADDGKR